MMNIQSTRDNRVWRQGPAPFIGWWNASWLKAKNTWRWWDGSRWSGAVYEGASAESIEFVLRDMLESDFEWNDYWPENAVCPRLNPIHSSTVWKGKLWSWIDGELVSQPDPLPRRVEEFHRVCQALPEFKTIACPNHKFVDTKALEDELDAIEHRLGRVRKVLRGE